VDVQNTEHVPLNRGFEVRHGVFHGLWRFHDVFHSLLLLLCDRVSCYQGAASDSTAAQSISRNGAWSVGVHEIQDHGAIGPFYIEVFFYEIRAAATLAVLALAAANA
jgi:hypothetical protein